MFRYAIASGTKNETGMERSAKTSFGIEVWFALCDTLQSRTQYIFVFKHIFLKQRCDSALCETARSFPALLFHKCAQKSQRKLNDVQNSFLWVKKSHGRIVDSKKNRGKIVRVPQCGCTLYSSVEWFRPFCDFRKATHFCISCIFSGVCSTPTNQQLQTRLSVARATKFSFSKKHRSFINAYFWKFVETYLIQYIQSPKRKFKIRFCLVSLHF